MKKSTENAIFVYGTLSFDEVLSALLGRKLTGIAATITDYQRIRVKNKRYPGLIACPGHRVEGALHSQISSDEMALLDTFEDDFYKKESLKIRLKSGDFTFADTYVVPPENLHVLSDSIWNREEFAKKHLKDYVEMVDIFRREYLKGHRQSQIF